MIFSIIDLMKSFVKYSLFAILFFAVGSCKKKDYPNEPAAPAPVFTFNGNINGTPVSISAGMNNYYMSTNYSTDANGVYAFMGEFKDAGCTTGCTNALKISINDYRPATSLPSPVIDSSLAPGYYTYSIPIGDSIKTNVYLQGSLKNGTAQSYLWNFGDGTTSTQQNVYHKYLHPGVYHTTLTAVSTSSYTSTVSKNVQVGQTGNAFEAIFNQVSMGSSTTFTSGLNGQAPIQSYSWNFGDGYSDITANPIHVYPGAGVYLASLTKTDATGYTDTFEKYIIIPTTSTSYPEIAMLPGNAVPNPMHLANVVVEWADINGTWWTSNSLSGQSNKSMFRIISVSDYQNNNAGQKTKKIHAKINCTLYNGTQSIQMDNADIVFSVAYP